MEQTVYHQILRISSLVIALVLLFDSGILAPETAALSQNTQQYLANAVGVSASVQPTELSLATAELTARDQELDAREAEVAAREIALRENPRPETPGGAASTFILSTILFIMLVLIVLNYGLDYARARQGSYVQIRQG